MNDIDPFLLQLVIIPFLTIGLGFLSAYLLKKMILAPLLTTIFIVCTEWYLFGYLSSWSLILPSISLFITGFILFVKAYNIHSDIE